MIDKIAQTLNIAYSKIENSTDNLSIASVLYSIIQIKSRHTEAAGYHQSLYVDIKQFIDVYVDGVVESDSDYGYDKVNTDKIIRTIKAVESDKQRIQLWKRAEAELAEHGLIGECNVIRTHCKKSVIKESFTSCNIISWLKGFCYLSVYNVWTVLLTISFVFAINYVITLPISTEECPMFFIEHEHFSDNLFWNHFLTYFASVLDLTDITFCRAGNIIGILVLLSFKLFYILYGGWNAVDIIREKFTLNNE